jgi:SOS-response transcriptional repressor LexA
MTSSRDPLPLADATRLASNRLASVPVRAEAAAPVCEDGEAHGVFALQVLGDSMRPEFEPGDIVVVEPDGRIDDGSFVVARTHGEWALRQLRRSGAGWVLAALDPQVPVEALDDLAAVRGVVIQKSKPGRRRTIKRYDGSGD